MLLCCAVPAQAGLFTDDEAHKLIEQLEARVVRLEATDVQIKGTMEQQTRSMLDLQAQIEALNTELRKLRGQNEELLHGAQDGEKRIKDFYVDLDARLRLLETGSEAAKVAAASAPPVPVVTDPSDPAVQNRAYESAYALIRAGNHENTAKAFRDFLGKYPDSVYVPNAKYALGNALFALRDYKGALEIYQELLGSAPGFAKAADAMFSVAGCQQELNQNAAARKTLKQLVVKYPGTEPAVKASQLLSAQ
jgi:tol-pal system protein YbgF